MTARTSYVFMKNFPVVTCNAHEGTLTRYTTGFNEVGGQQDVAVYQYPISKGDLVRLDVSSTELNVITVEQAIAGNDLDEVIGMAVSSPWGVDNATTSAGTPTAAYQRKVDVAFFGIGIIELESNGTIPVGSGLELSESETNVVGDNGTDYGSMVALTYSTDGVKIAVLVGYAGHNPAD